MTAPRKPIDGDDLVLEREHELEVIAQALSTAGGGSGSLVMVEGPGGIGKTTLLSRARVEAAREGFLVRAARGGEMEHEMPFGVVRQLFEPLVERASEKERATWLSGSARRALVALGRSEEGSVEDVVDSPADPFSAMNGLYWLVANVAVPRPVLLAVDDAQWADIPSLRFLTFLARRLSDIPVFLVVAVRTGEPTEPRELEALRTEALSVTPLPLTPDSVTALIALRTGGPPDADFAEACSTASAGNPFLVNEILRELQATGQRIDGDAAGALSTLAPENVVRTVLTRLDRFGPDAAAIAHAVAVLGRSPQLRHAAALAGLDEATARSAIDGLRKAEMLAPGTPIDFVHPLIRQAVYRSLPDEQRAATHRRAAELLAGAGATPGEVGAHLLACPPNGDGWVVERLQEAAQAAFQEGALETSVTYLDRALEEPPDDDLLIRYHLAISLLAVDIVRAPEVLADVAARTVDPVARVDILRRLAAAQSQLGDMAGTAATYEEALATVDESDRDVPLVLEAERYFFTLASRGRQVADPSRLAAVARGLTGATPGERAVRQVLALDRFLTATPIEEMAELCLPAPEEPDWQVAGQPSLLPVVVGKVLAWSGWWEQARRVFAARAEAFHRVGQPLAMSLAYAMLSEVDRLAGRLQEAESEATTAWQIAGMERGFSLYGWGATMHLAATLLARGDVDRFLDLVGDTDLSAGPPEIPVNPWPVELRAHLRLEQGDLEGAADDLIFLGTSLEDLGWVNPCYPMWRQEAGEVLAALGRTAQANELIDLAGERAERVGVPHAVGTTLRARGLLQPRRRALETLRRSVEVLDAAGPPHELARSLLVLGGTLRRAGDRTEAREALHRALEVAYRCGTGGVERRVREELAAAGARPRRPERSGLGALTATELKTAKLAAGGFSNKEIAERLFVSIRTVETHLTSVYDKLGISGRRELTNVLTEAG